MRKRRSGSNCGFTLLEVLVVIAIIGVLLGLLLPALERAREHADNLRCAANLEQIGVGLLIYSNENHGQYPRTIYDPAAPLCVGTNPAAPDPFATGGPNPNDESSPLFLLMRVETLPAKLFVDPYTDEVEGIPDPATDILSRSNFSNYKANLSYSYANPYPSAAAVKAGYQFTNRMNPQFALAADLNPGVAGRNSRNHEGRGQNVLFADNHVEWEQTPLCGVSQDDIYSNQAGVVQGSPLNSTDSVLLPID